MRGDDGRLRENIAHVFQSDRAANAEAPQRGAARKDKCSCRDPAIIQPSHRPAGIYEKWTALDGLLDPFCPGKISRPC